MNKEEFLEISEKFYKKDIGLEAVQQNGYALAYVKDQTPEICVLALEKDPSNFEYIKINHKEIEDYLENIK